MMTPHAHFFGRDQHLLGFHTVPDGQPRGESVLICPPVFGEASRAHWVARELSGKLAGLGYHVFRFDFSASGNSRGNSSDLTPHDLVLDVLDAAAEAEDRGPTVTAAFAMRLSALFTLRALAERDAQLPVWDPIVSGTRARAIGKSTLDRLARDLERPPADEPVLFGARVRPEFIEDLSALGCIEPVPSRLHVFLSKGESLGPCLSDAPHTFVDGAYAWETEDINVHYAHDLVQSVCSHLQR